MASVEVRDVAPGLWLWRRPHPEWAPHRAMLELPFEHVLVSHGVPAHSRADFEAALERQPYGD